MLFQCVFLINFFVSLWLGMLTSRSVAVRIVWKVVWIRNLFSTLLKVSNGWWKYICHILYSTNWLGFRCLITSIGVRVPVESIYGRLNPYFHVYMMFIRYMTPMILIFMLFIILVLWMNVLVWHWSIVDFCLCIYIYI